MPLKRQNSQGENDSGVVNFATGDGYVATYAMSDSYDNLNQGGFPLDGSSNVPVIWPLDAPGDVVIDPSATYNIGMTGRNWGSQDGSGAYPDGHGVENTGITITAGSSWMNLDISGTSNIEVNYTNPVGTFIPKDPPVYTNLANAIDMGEVFPPANDPLSSQTNLGYKSVGVYFIIYYPKVI